MATQLYNVHGEIFSLQGQPEAAISALNNDGVLVISQRSKIQAEINSANKAHAKEVGGYLGFTTWEFVKKEIFMSPDVGEVLFLVNRRYIIGVSKLLIPISNVSNVAAPLERYKPYVATLFGGPQHSHLTFHLLVRTLRGELKELAVKGGDILVCAAGIERTIPQTPHPRSHTAFVSETFYYPPDMTPESVGEELAQKYMSEGGTELARDAQGNVVWAV